MSFQGFSQTRIMGNIMRGALWGVEDESHLEKEYRPIGQMVKMRKKLIKSYEKIKDQKERVAFFPTFRDRFSELSNAIASMLYSYEDRLERVFNDQKSGTVWKDGSAFNPHYALVIKNRTLNDGVDRYGLLITGETIKTFRFIAAGEGNAKPNPGQTGLQNEAFRDLVDFLTASGNVIKTGITIPKGMTSKSFKEFGGTDEPVDPSVFAWRVRIKNAPFMEHTQNVTSPQMNHTTLLAVEQIV